MKYRVVGWISYDEEGVADAPADDAAVAAIIDDIRANNYVFSGWHHQEALQGAPVLNDGKRRVFSQRTFGAIMASAHGYNGPYDYSLFAFQLPSEEVVMAKSWFCVKDFVPETDLCETFERTVSRSDYERAQAEQQLCTEDADELRYIGVGDTLLLCCEGERMAFAVEGVMRRPKADAEAYELVLTLRRA